MRNWILDNCSIKNVKYLGKCFQKVQTEVIRLDLTRKHSENKTAICRGNKIYSVNPLRFRKRPQIIFDFNCTERDYSILESLELIPHQTLNDRAKWILGVVSGDNERFVSHENKGESKPIISGRDITPYQIEKPMKFLDFDREQLQQCAPLEAYCLSPKIVYQFISGKPAFAIDRNGFVTLNSANSFYPLEGLSSEIITAFFNSSLYKYILQKRFNSIKILRHHLENLPIPLLSTEDERTIKDIVLLIESSKEDQREILIGEMDRRVFNLFNISHSDRNYILEQL